MLYPQPVEEVEGDQVIIHKNGNLDYQLILLHISLG